MISKGNAIKAKKVKWAHLVLVASILSIAIAIVLAMFQLFYICSDSLHLIICLYKFTEPPMV
jgi:hypothetical protein